MERLRDEVGEAVQLIIREGDQAIYVEKIEGTQPVPPPVGNLRSMRVPVRGVFSRSCQRKRGLPISIQ
ncbi:hypothetical protein BACPU_12290 [Bacillus pumilus]|nr:hypothetical protein BACPU_12290 [Bacillus pumilus]